MAGCEDMRRIIVVKRGYDMWMEYTCMFRFFAGYERTTTISKCPFNHFGQQNSD